MKSCRAYNVKMRQWKTFQQNLISSFLSDLIDQDGVIVWQQNDDRRNLYSGKVRDVGNGLCTVELNAVDLSKNTPKDNEPFYLHAKLRDLAFKKGQVTIKDNILEFELPSEVLVRERRQSERLNYQRLDEQRVMLRSENRGGDFLGILVNISSLGLGLHLDSTLGKDIKVKDEMLLKKIMDVKFDQPVKLVVKHWTRMPMEGEEVIYVGLEFESELGVDLKNIIQDKAMRVKGISDEEFCGHDLEDQIGKLNVISRENNQLAINIRKNLSELDKIRYLSDEMKMNLIASVDMDLLACSMRLSDKELIFELISILTKNLQKDFLEKLAIAKPASAVCKAQDSILKIIRQKVSDGEYRMDPKNKMTYV